MRLLKLVAAAVCLTVFAPARAGTQTVTFTITTPPVLNWVDVNNNVVAPYLQIGSTPAYVDADGYTWYVQAPASTTPTLGSWGTGVTYYTSSDCSGTPYFAFDANTALNLVYMTYYGGAQLYAGGEVVNVGGQIAAMRSWQGCIAHASMPATTTMYTVVGPLTPPLVPAGPWRVVVR